MSKKLLEINVSAEGAQGRVEIVGSISEWNSNNATDMRDKCTELKNSGVSRAYVYLMTVGGDCFQANEIVNILHDIFGSYDAGGGAIVASAGTYIAVCAETFEMAKNGQFMIHKPMGGTFGNENEVESQLTLLRNMSITYFEAYVAKLKKPEQEFKDKWNGGDFWMTAKEAVEWGFATSVKESVVIDKQTQALLSAMGREYTNLDKQQNMSLKLIASALGMPESSSEAEVRAVVAANAKKASDYDALVTQNAEREKTEKAARIKACLDNAEKNKQIKADARPNWQAQFEKDEAGTKALLDGILAVAKPLSADIKVSADGNGSTYQGKTFEQLQDSSPELLAELAENDPDAYASLFADWKKRNRI